MEHDFATQEFDSWSDFESVDLGVMRESSQRAAVFFLPVLVLLFSFSGKRKQFVPPGTVQITESFFADACEISNLSWIEFEYWTCQTYGYHSKEHLASLPDTLVWRNPKLYNEPYVQYYYRHIAYRNFPVIGISYEQAVAYCKWRTERVKAFYALRYKKELKIEYRPPVS